MSRLKYLQVKNITKSSADIYFYGEIVGDEWGKWCDTDTCPDDIVKALKETDGKSLNIFINSPGGNVFAGLAIYNMLKRKPEPKTCYVDGVAASIASVICMCGENIKMPKNAFLMIHKPSSFAVGNAEDMRKAADDLDIIEGGIMEVYRENLTDEGLYDEVKKLVANETWLSAEQAAKYFKNITVVEENKATARLDKALFADFKNVPSMVFDSPTEDEEGKGETERLEAELELYSF